MDNPIPEPRIQRVAGASECSTTFAGTTDASSTDAPIGGGGQRHPTLSKGVAFGALAGLLMGAVVGAVCCWLIGLFDSMRHAVLIGALVGPWVGAIVGFVERKSRGNLARPDTATFVCVVMGILPSLVVGLQFLGAVNGRLSVYLLAGAAFAGPMSGLLVGALLDRAFEAILKESWSTALALATVGAGGCIAAVCLIDSLAYGPDPREVAADARAILVSEWKEDPDLRGAKVRQVTLVRKGRRTYTGVADVTIAGQPRRMMLEVLVEGDMIEVKWNAEPPGEPGG